MNVKRNYFKYFFYILVELKTLELSNRMISISNIKHVLNTNDVRIRKYFSTFKKGMQIL